MNHSKRCLVPLEYGSRTCFFGGVWADCSCILTCVSLFMFDWICPLPTMFNLLSVLGEQQPYISRRTNFPFCFLTWLDFRVCLLCIPAASASLMPLNPVSLSWSPGLRAWSTYLWPPVAAHPVSRVSFPSSLGQDRKPTLGGASSPSSACSLICDGFPIMGRDDESKERRTDGERYLRAARAAV